jgi:hypothetical protein
MADHEGFPPGVPCWIDVAPPDTDGATEFYGGLFGWEFENRMPADADARYMVARLDGLDVAAIGTPPDPAAPVAWATYIGVASADESATAVRAAGGTVLMGPFDVMDAGRMAVCADPTGAAFNLWQPGRTRGAQMVNAPGSWNWSNLTTRDPHAAISFYDAVFGWLAAPVDVDDALMLQLPGYGDWLAERDPTLRERHAALGVPAGFSDIVAWLQPVTSGSVPDDVPSHWDVTFAVEDPDALAERVTDLGGSVVTAPLDTGPVRMAVLADPWGATFTISHYAP